MIQLINDDLQYTYNCVNPCGEDDIIVEVKNDFRSQDANVGLSVSSNMLQFIKEDADEVRYLIDTGYDYKVNLNNLALYQLDLMNYEDDGIIVKVPIISSSLKDYLQNTTLEALQIAKAATVAFVKKPSVAVSFHSEGTAVGSGIGSIMTLTDIGVEAISGTLPNNMQLYSNEYSTAFVRRALPLGDARVNAPDSTIVIEGDILVERGGGSLPRGLVVNLQSAIIGVLDDNSEVVIGTPVMRTETYNITEGVSYHYVMSRNDFPTIRIAEDAYVDPVTLESHLLVGAFQQYSLSFRTIYLTGQTPTPGKVNVSVNQNITIEGEMFFLDYRLPAISMSSIQQELNTKGISIPIISGNYYITSANVDKLRSTRLLDIVTFFARMKGNVLDFSTINVCAGHDLFYWGFVNLGNTYCNWQKKGFPQCFSHKIGQNPSKLRLSNTPESMWQNTYTTAQNSQLLKEDSITSPIISDGAEILNVLISNSQEVFIVDNSNSELTSDDDLPINYSFSAVCVAYNNRERIFSNAPVMMNEFTPADTSGVVFTIPNHIAGLTTLSTISYKGQPRLSPYTIEMDVPMTQSLIAQILSQGYLVGVTIDGTDYYVEECSLKLAPHQCHLSLREVISTPL